MGARSNVAQKAMKHIKGMSLVPLQAWSASADPVGERTLRSRKFNREGSCVFGNAIKYKLGTNGEEGGPERSSKGPPGSFNHCEASGVSSASPHIERGSAEEAAEIDAG